MKEGNQRIYVAFDASVFTFDDAGKEACLKYERDLLIRKLFSPPLADSVHRPMRVLTAEIMQPSRISDDVLQGLKRLIEKEMEIRAEFPEAGNER